MARRYTVHDKDDELALKGILTGLGSGQAPHTTTTE